MKTGKAAGSSGVVAEILKSAVTDGVRWMADLFKQITLEEKISDDWKKEFGGYCV